MILGGADGTRIITYLRSSLPATTISAERGKEDLYHDRALGALTYM